LLSVFWHRLLGTGGIWFCNDWYFYGNGVFRSTFVGILVGSKASVQVNWLYSYINAGVQVMSCCSVKALTLKGHTTLPLHDAAIASKVVVTKQSRCHRQPHQSCDNSQLHMHCNGFEDMFALLSLPAKQSAKSCLLGIPV
jgi:hypothetical protein